MNEAIKALKAGNRKTAFTLLRGHLRIHPNDVNAWLWMSEAASDPEQQSDALERVLELAPEHAHANSIRKRLRDLTSPPPSITQERQPPSDSQERKPLFEERTPLSKVRTPSSYHSDPVQYPLDDLLAEVRAELEEHLAQKENARSSFSAFSTPGADSPSANSALKAGVAAKLGEHAKAAGIGEESYDENSLIDEMIKNAEKRNREAELKRAQEAAKAAASAKAAEAPKAAPSPAPSVPQEGASSNTPQAAPEPDESPSLMGSISRILFISILILLIVMVVVLLLSQFNFIELNIPPLN